MFRKYYKAAMDDINPDEAFVLSVIENAAKRKPPVYARYMKYAAAIAAAVVVVSGVVLSMPLWQRVTDDTDGVIIEETVTDNTAESAASVPSAVPTASPQLQATVKPKDAAQARTSQNSYSALGEREPQSSQTEPIPETTETVQEKTAEVQETQQTMDTTAEVQAEDNEPMFAKVYSSGGSAASRSYKAATPAMPSFNAPSGYHEVYSSGDYYEFENDDGDNVTVSIYWTGGADSEEVYSSYDEAYTAETVKNGYNITIYGTNKAAVDEIINSLG